MIRRSAVALMLCLAAAFASTAHAGVLQTLPKDGVWTTYYTEMKAEVPADQQITGTMTVRSVGSVEEDGEKCRWIEIEMKAARNDGEKQNVTMKFLVEEKGLKAGAKTAPKIIRGWTKNNDQEIKEMSEQEKSSNGPIGLFLISRMKETKTVKREKTIDYQKGQLKIPTAVVGHPEFNVGENKPPDLKYDITQSVWLHKSIPFGIAARELQLEFNIKGKVASKMKLMFTVQDYGTGAKSIWPDKK